MFRFHEVAATDMFQQNSRKEIITIHYRATRLGRFFGCLDHKKQFIGRCTVWHSLPDFVRQGTLKEGWLASIWERHKYERSQLANDVGHDIGYQN